MSCHPRVTEWTDTIQAHLPHLSKPQATVLALWSLGMVLARSCALTAVSAFLAPWLGRKEHTVRQQLREFCYEAAAKRGTDRGALRVETCFVPLLAWVVSWWQGTQLALALDATTLGTRFTVLALSVVYRGCAIPVAWIVLPATAKHAWRREWLRMLRQVRRAVPRSWTVIVLADRGLYARWLFRRITRAGLASVFAHQHRRDVSSSRPGAWGAAEDLGARAGHVLAGDGHRLQRPPPPAPLHPAGLLGGGLQGSVVDPDRSAAGGQYGLLVWVAGLDRTGLQDHQARGLAVAAHPHDHTRAGRAPVAGRRRRHPVAAERRGRSGGDDPGEYGPGRHGLGPHAAADAACHPPAAGECLSPGLDPDPGGVAHPGTAAAGALRA